MASKLVASRAPLDYRMGMTDDEVRARIAAVPHWYHAIEIWPGIITPGANEARRVLACSSVFACDAMSSPAAAYYTQIATGRSAREGISS